jgi:hypothetical protein
VAVQLASQPATQLAAKDRRKASKAQASCGRKAYRIVVVAQGGKTRKAASIEITTKGAFVAQIPENLARPSFARILSHRPFHRLSAREKQTIFYLRGTISIHHPDVLIQSRHNNSLLHKKLDHRD